MKLEKSIQYFFVSSKRGIAGALRDIGGTKAILVTTCIIEL